MLRSAVNTKASTAEVQDGSVKLVGCTAYNTTSFCVLLCKSVIESQVTESVA